jgi:hypothetical protein
MILTHLLALTSMAPAALSAATSVLQLSSSAALISGGPLDPALLPRLKLRRPADVLPVRGD